MLQSWTLFHFQRSKTSLILSFPFYFRRKRGFDYSILKNRVVPQFLSPFNKKKKKKKLFPRQRLNFLFCYERIKLKLALSFSSFFLFQASFARSRLVGFFFFPNFVPFSFFFFFLYIANRVSSASLSYLPDLSLKFSFFAEGVYNFEF